MAATDAIHIDPTENRVHVEDLSVHDADLVEFLEEFEGPDRERALEQALVVGATTLQFAGTSKDLEFVKSEFKALQDTFEGELEAFKEELETARDELKERLGDDGDLERALDDHFGEEGALSRRLERAFGEDGIFADRLDDELGEDGERIKAALDPTREGTPTYQLKERLVEELREIQTQLDEEAGREEIRQESWHKGEEFEDQIGTLLDGIVNRTPHEYEQTTEQTGELQGKKVGDFVVDLGDVDQRIVIEAKHGNFNRTVEDEMDLALENRDADFGILVAESLEYLPRTKVGWFSEIDQEYVVVALSDEGDEEVEPRFFQFAFHWAKTRAMLATYETSDGVDTEALKTELDGIEGAIEDFSNIRTQCTNIEDARSNIESTLNEIEREVETRLQRVQSNLLE